MLRKVDLGELWPAKGSSGSLADEKEHSCFDYSFCRSFDSANGPSRSSGKSNDDND